MKALLRFHFREHEDDGYSAPASTDLEVTPGTPVWIADVIKQDQVLISVELVMEKENP
jgi:hypothetical protein